MGCCGVPLGASLGLVLACGRGPFSGVGDPINGGSTSGDSTIGEPTSVDSTSADPTTGNATSGSTGGPGSSSTGSGSTGAPDDCAWEHTEACQGSACAAVELRWNRCIPELWVSAHRQGWWIAFNTDPLFEVLRIEDDNTVAVVSPVPEEGTWLLHILPLGAGFTYGVNSEYRFYDANGSLVVTHPRDGEWCDYAFSPDPGYALLVTPTTGSCSDQTNLRWLSGEGGSAYSVETDQYHNAAVAPGRVYYRLGSAVNMRDLTGALSWSTEVSSLQLEAAEDADRLMVRLAGGSIVHLAGGTVMGTPFVLPDFQGYDGPTWQMFLEPNGVYSTTYAPYTSTVHLFRDGERQHTIAMGPNTQSIRGLDVSQNGEILITVLQAEVVFVRLYDVTGSLIWETELPSELGEYKPHARFYHDPDRFYLTHALGLTTFEIQR